MRAIVLPIAVVCLIASAAHAQSTRPSNEPFPRRHYIGPDGVVGGRYGRNIRPPEQPIVDAEWDQVAVFMKAYSPKRWKAFQNTPENQQSRLKGYIYNAWKSLEHMKQENPDIYDVRLKRLPVEDEIFDLAGQIKKAGSTATKEQHEQLKDQVTKFMDLRLEERKKRVAKLEETLAKERKELADAESRRDKMVDARTDEVEKQGPSALMHDRREQDEPQVAPHDDSVTHSADELPRSREKH